MSIYIDRVKKCNDCGEKKYHSEFYTRRDRADTVRHVCKDCDIRAAREWNGYETSAQTHGRDLMQLHTRIPKSVKDRIDAIAEERKMSKARVVTMLLEYALVKLEKEQRRP